MLVDKEAFCWYTTYKIVLVCAFYVSIQDYPSHFLFIKSVNRNKFDIAVTILATSFCIFSYSSFSQCVQLPHTTLAYSKPGQMEVNMVSWDCRSSSTFSFCITFILFHAFP